MANWLTGKNPFASAPTTQVIPTNQNTNIPKNPTDPNDPPNNTNIELTTDNKDKDLNKDATGDGSLGDFSKLWETVPDDPKNPKPPVDPDFTPQLDPVKFEAMLNKIDFTKAVTPEQKAAIVAGGEGATTALMEILNITNRQTFATMFSANQRMMESTLKAAHKRFLDAVPAHVKNMMVTNALTSSNPIMQNPAYAPLVENIRAQMQDKYPKATPAQLETAVNSYFDQMANDITKGKDKNNSNVDTNQSKLRTGDPSADWEGWMESEFAKNQV